MGPTRTADGGSPAYARGEQKPCGLACEQPGYLHCYLSCATTPAKRLIISHKWPSGPLSCGRKDPDAWPLVLIILALVFVGLVLMSWM